jgi:hypothetical protein
MTESLRIGRGRWRKFYTRSMKHCIYVCDFFHHNFAPVSLFSVLYIFLPLHHIS